MKNALRIITLFALALTNTALAHPGRTDSKGGHTDRSTGSYHYHNGGGSSSVSTPIRTTARLTAPSVPRSTARSAVRTVAYVPQSVPAKSPAQSEFQKAKATFEDAVAALEKIKIDYPGSDEAKQAQELLLIHCQGEQSALDSKLEREADSKLRLAKSFFDRGKTSDGIRWLKDIVGEYGETKAGKEAIELLKKWE